jgi:hypothetical protein
VGVTAFNPAKQSQMLTIGLLPLLASLMKAPLSMDKWNAYHSMTGECQEPWR